MSKQIIKSVFIFALFLIFSAEVEAYTPPIGIPDPGMWGSTHPIDSVAPATSEKCPDWPAAATVGCYYIDNTHPSATDSSNPNGYPDKPRKTIQKTSYAAGTYMEMHGGPYAWSSSGTVTFNGTATDPVWVRGVPEAKPTFTGEFIAKGSYIFFENIFFSTGKIGFRSHNGSTIHHSVIRNCLFTGDGLAAWGSVIAISGPAVDTMHNIVVYNNTISEYGDNYAILENDAHGVHPTTYVHDVWILNNDIKNLGGDSVQIGIASIPDSQRPHHIYVGANKFGGNFEDDIDIKESDHIIVSGNDLGATDSRVSGSDGVCMVVHNGPTNVWILFNKFHDNRTGLISTSATDLYIIGNTFVSMHPTYAFDATESGFSYNGHGTGVAWYSTAGEVKVLDNTFYDCAIGVQGRMSVSGSSTISGNVFANRSEPLGYDIYAASDVARLDINHNIFSNGIFGWNSTVQRNMIYLQSVGECANCLDIGASFVSAPVNLQLTTESVGIDIGIEDSAYTKYYNLYGISISKDQAGVSRPQGVAWDVGAFEYVAAEVQPDVEAPEVPNGVSVA